MRYLSQHDQYSCGPVALMNILRWIGLDIHYRNEIEWFQEITHCREDGILMGTTFGDMTRALKKFKNLLTYHYLKHPKMLDLILNLALGRVVILSYRIQPKCKRAIPGHYIVIIEKKGEKYLCLNTFNGKAKRWIPEKEVERFFEISRQYPVMWVINKKGHPKVTPTS